MDIAKELEEAKSKRQKLVDEINQINGDEARLGQKKQLLLQEVLKTEGAVEVLEKLSKGGKDG